jgi:hypothetical protein
MPHSVRREALWLWFVAMADGSSGSSLRCFKFLWRCALPRGLCAMRKGGAELPPPVFRRQAPLWARGWVGDPRARSRTPPTSAPFTKKIGLACINRAPLQTLPRQLQATLQQLTHRVLLRATPSTTCTAKNPCVAPTASTACTTKAIPMVSIAIRRGGSPPPFPRG